MKRASLMLCLLAACTAPKAPAGANDPVTAAESFSRALQDGDTAAAWGLLSTATQQRAEALAAKARVSADAGPESGKAMLFQGALPSGVVFAHEVSGDGGAAVVSVSLDGGPARDYRAVHEPAGWKIELDL